MKLFLRGLRSGIPIGLGYLSVSFSFGIMALSMGFTWWQAVIISMTTVTSAGQLAALDIMIHPAQYAAMLISQLTVNVRYSFMSISLSQKVSDKFTGIKRWLLGFFMTDEIFAVAAAEDEVDPKFFAGLSVIPYIGWTLGTLLGALIGNVLGALEDNMLSSMVMGALCLAIYGMFLAIMAPVARKSRAVLAVVGIAGLLHCAFYFIPGLNQISSGISISICAIVAAVVGALLFPVKDEATDAEEVTA